MGSSELVKPFPHSCQTQSCSHSPARTRSWLLRLHPGWTFAPHQGQVELAWNLARITPTLSRRSPVSTAMEKKSLNIRWKFPRWKLQGMLVNWQVRLFNWQVRLFNWQVCWSTGKYVGQLAGTFNWHVCWSTGRYVGQLACMLVNWQVCWSTGRYVQLAGTFNWQVCWSTGRYVCSTGRYVGQLASTQRTPLPLGPHLSFTMSALKKGYSNRVLLKKCEVKLADRCPSTGIWQDEYRNALAKSPRWTITSLWLVTFLLHKRSCR